MITAMIVHPEALQAAINRRQAISTAQVDARLAAEFAAWQAQIQQMAAQVRAAGEHLANMMSDAQSAEAHRLYHALARRLHPDVNPGGSDYEKHLWHWATEACQQGNLADLRTLAAMVGPATAFAAQEWVGEWLKISARVFMSDI